MPLSVRAGRGLPVRLEPRDRRAERRDGDGEGRACPALPQPHDVRAGLSARDAGDGVRRPRPGVRLLQGRLHARHLRQHEDGGGDDLRRQGAALQSPLPADVRPLSGRAGRLHAGVGLGEGAGREPGRPGARALLHAAAAVQELRRAERLAARQMHRLRQGASASRASRSRRSGRCSRRSGRAWSPYARPLRRLPCACRPRCRRPAWCASTTTNTRSAPARSAARSRSMPMPIGSSSARTARSSREHRRCFGRGQTIYDPWHYVPVLARKPGRAAQRRAVQGLGAAGGLERVRRKLAGADDGDRQMVAILAAVLTDGLAGGRGRSRLVLTLDGGGDDLVESRLHAVELTAEITEKPARSINYQMTNAELTLAKDILDQFLCMAFAQLTYRESLRDIETCLSAQAAKLYHMGFREAVRRSTLADANETRDWRIYAELAHRLIAQARKLYASESLGFELSTTVYALDSTTIDLCLSLFPWAHFRTTKAAVKLHTLLDLRGSIPSFIHISDGKLHDVNALDLLLPEPGAIYVMDRGYVDFARLLCAASGRCLLRHPRQVEHGCPRGVYSAPTDRAAGIICRPDHRAGRPLQPPATIPSISAASASRTPTGQDPRLPHQPVRLAGTHNRRPLQEPMASRAVLQMDQAAPAHQTLLWHLARTP